MLSKDAVWISVYCWLCGEEDVLPFSLKNVYPKNMGRAGCPACGAIIWVGKRDIVEVKDRREMRGIPR